MCASGKWNTCASSLGGNRGTHFVLRHRNVHVQVICSKRPVWRRSTVGEVTGSYGRKVAVTRRRCGSTHFVSATIAMRAGDGVAEQVAPAASASCTP